MNLGYIKDRVKRAFGDQSGAQISDVDIKNWVNEAQIEIAVKAHLLQARATASSIVGTRNYSVTTLNLLELHSVSYKGQALQSWSLQQANEIVGSIESANYPTGAPQFYWLREDSIFLYPAPDEAVAAGITILFTKRPTEVVNDADEPEIPVKYHNRILDYCLQQGYQQDDNWDAAALMSRKFEQGVSDTQHNTQHELYPFITPSAEDSDY